VIFSNHTLMSMQRSTADIELQVSQASLKFGMVFDQSSQVSNVLPAPILRKNIADHAKSL